MVLPTVILPGYFAGAAPYQALAQALNQQGMPTMIVPLRRRDWVPTLGGRSVTPILEKLDRTVQEARSHHHCSHINLVGHSAGGWIARIYLGETPYTVHSKDAQNPQVWNAQNTVKTLICLGTPHRSEERWTKRNIDFVNQTYPGAFYPQVRYVCVAGKSVLGKRTLLGSSFAYKSYQLTCGQGDCWGDGITPITAAHLEGAENITLDGIHHSPGRDRQWYGSDGAWQIWASYLTSNVCSSKEPG